MESRGAEQAPAAGWAARAAHRLLFAMAGVLALLAIDYTVGLPLPAFARSTWDWSYQALEFSAAAVCALRALSERRERIAWLVMALGIFSYGCADLYWSLVLSHLKSIPYPSLADPLYLAFYPAAYIGLLLLLRSRGGRFPASVWLDGAIGAVGLGAVVGALVFPVVLDTTGGDTMTIVTNISYPIVDLALLALVTCVVGLMGWRPGLTWSLLAGGFALFAMADTIYLYETARGTYVGSGWLDVCWPAGLLLVATASTRPARRVAAASFVGWPTLIVPATFGALSLVLVVYDHFTRLDTAAVLLAGATLALVLVRLALTFSEYIAAIAHSRREAVSDPLTGLGNRRALAAELDRALHPEDGGRHALAVYDLDGFKGYNDTFGHPAGDALLVRCAQALAAGDHGGAAFRLGGDEFCLLVPLPGEADRDEAERVARAGANALTTWGQGFEIGSSYGVALLPEEAASPPDAIRLADQRMYARKRGGGRSGTGATIDALIRAMQERGTALGEHGADVADIAARLAAVMGMPESECEHVRNAAALHDVGKLAIPDSILNKPGPLDEAEWEFMRSHAEIGERILGDAPSLAVIGGLVRASHEHWDGSGYPDRLAGDDIPLGARVISLCDAYHAMITPRTYRAATTHADAIAEVRRCAGTQFDPTLIEPFVEIVEQRLTAAPARLAA